MSDDKQQNPGFAGLPTTSNDIGALAGALSGRDASSLRKERPYTEYTLPAKLLSKEYADSKFSEKDLTFRMVELRLAESERASKLAGKDKEPIKVANEMLFQAVYQIGDWSTRNDRDSLEEWWEAIGARCRGLVQAAFVSMQSPEEEDVAMFLNSGKSGCA